MPLNRWQRFVSRLTPWYDPDEQDRKFIRTAKLASEVSRIDSIRISYRDAGNRLDGMHGERRSQPR